jgi:hypothetical protein
MDECAICVRAGVSQSSPSFGAVSVGEKGWRNPFHLEPAHGDEDLMIERFWAHRGAMFEKGKHSGIGDITGWTSNDSPSPGRSRQ